MINQKKYRLKSRKHYLTRLADFWLARIMRDCCRCASSGCFCSCEIINCNYGIHLSPGHLPAFFLEEFISKLCQPINLPLKFWNDGNRRALISKQRLDENRATG
jgi:hypothetical protein